jgi:hypothetical protein
LSFIINGKYSCRGGALLNRHANFPYSSLAQSNGKVNLKVWIFQSLFRTFGMFLVTGICNFGTKEIVNRLNSNELKMQNKFHCTQPAQSIKVLKYHEKRLHFRQAFIKFVTLKLAIIATHI